MPGDIVVAALGGTIASARPSSGGVAPSLTAQDLIDAVPGLPPHVEALSFRSLPGSSVTVPDLMALHELLEQRFAAGAAGAVVTQGTDTIEESAYAMDLVHRGPQPIVVTGAMRNPMTAGPDGPANLLAAVTVAGSPLARDLGCVVVFADEIHPASRVRKTHSTSTGTFVSVDGGPLGYLVEGSPVVVNPRAARHTLPRPASRPRIAVYTATLGDDGAPLEALAGAVDGLVIAGFGVGHVPAGWTPLIDSLCARMPVVLATRTGSGPVLRHTYGYPGSESDLRRRGLISAGFLHPYKARLLLQFALAAGANPAQLTAAFDVAGQVSSSERWPF
ncbi:asparaginase [Actinoplanes sp. NPDC051411]|uniref:asparaginase n=1 Tax=Actinoplanes sp. NPDC051411 TaxID=3155522 RepID=UPI0034184525